MNRGRSQFRPARILTNTCVQFFFAIVVVLVCSSQIAARQHKSDHDSGQAKDAETSKITIENFGKVCDHLYRGGQPNRNEYAELTRIGIKTVLDLRDDPKSYARESAEASGLKYINLPMSDHDFPAADSAEHFLRVVNDPDNWPVFVHCAGGRHRTGAMTAVYRMTVDGWDIDRAYKEMKDYNFYTKWGHGEMKEYVFDYFSSLREKRAHPVDTAISPNAPDATLYDVGVEPTVLTGLLCPLSRHSSGRELHPSVRDPRTELPILLRN